jgi:hypothetical protein
MYYVLCEGSHSQPNGFNSINTGDVTTGLISTTRPRLHFLIENIYSPHLEVK